MRLSRKQIIAIILKKKNAILGLLDMPRVPGMGIHQVTSEAGIRRFLRAYLKTAPVDSIKHNPYSGADPSWIVKLKGGQTALFKPDRAWGEAVAAGVDQIMGFNRVPVVVTRTVNDRPGVLMQWSKSSPTWFKKHNTFGPAFAPETPEAFHEMRMFDYVIGNADRHGGNFLLPAHGKQSIVPIDQANSLSSGFGYYASAFFASPAQNFDRSLRALTTASRKRLVSKLDRVVRSENKLKQIYGSNSGMMPVAPHPLADSLIEEMVVRAKYLKRRIVSEELDNQ